MSLFDYHSPSDYADERLKPERDRVPIPRTPQDRSGPVPLPPVPDPLQSRILLRDRKPPRATHVNRKQLSDSDIPRGLAARRERPAVERPGRSLELPKPSRRRKRIYEPSLALGLQIRPEERQLLTEVGKFRVISTTDLARFIYKGNESQFNQDLRFLREHNLVKTHLVNARRDGRSVDRVRRFEVATLTWYGQQLLQRSGELPEDQRTYSGLVKPREVEHDAQIYRAYLKELAGIERAGGRNVRVKLDFELKADIQRSIYLARRARPDRDLAEVKAEVAEQFQLTVHNNKIVIPDARIEYDLPTGGSAQVDIEVATSAYRRGHLAGKSQAGFRLYISRGDIGRLGPAIQDDHDIMSGILDF